METTENTARKRWNWELILGILFLIPPILGVFAFILCLLGGDNNFCSLHFLERYSLWGEHGEHGFSTAPVYLGLMALAGAYLIKGNRKK